MSWHSIFISHPSRLSTQNKRLRIEQQNEYTTIPLEDIGAIVLETPEISLTIPLLQEIARNSIPLFVCDEKHLPCALFQPFHQHSRQRKMLQSQLSQTRPFMKRCWQLVIQQKIRNQACCLRFLEREGYEDLEKLAQQVRSGDENNRESVAARFYFSMLMPGITRFDTDTINDALNYGYAIIRGALARSLAAYGFMPSLGLWHRNELNAFNLADDFLEPFRPLVDLWTIQTISPQNPFSRKDRISLVELFHKNVEIAAERQTVLRATELCIKSYSSACRERDPTLLALPKLLSLQ